VAKPKLRLVGREEIKKTEDDDIVREKNGELRSPSGRSVIGAMARGCLRPRDKDAKPLYTRGKPRKSDY